MNLFHYPPEEVISGDYMMTGLDQDEILQMLSYMTPDNMRITMVAPDVETDRIAEWYFTAYKSSPIDNARITSYNVCYTKLLRAGPISI